MQDNTIFKQKYENYQRSIQRQEGCYVPTGMINTGGGIFWAGKTAFDVAGDHEAYAKAMTSFLDEMWLDVNFYSGLTTSPRLDAAFPTAENRLAENGTLTHLQNPMMQVDEYDQLSADPKAFIMNVLLPRKFPELYKDRGAAKKALKVFAEEEVDIFVTQMAATIKYLAEHYGVPTGLNMQYLLNTPLDHIFDFFRGFRGTLTDLRRQPDKVRAALESIWEYRNVKMMESAFDASKGFAYQPCHIPAYLNPKQFAEFYWPYEKKLIEWVAASGGKIMLVMEGHWGNLMRYFLEVPKDSLVLQVDEDDVLEVKQVVGDHQIVSGGLSMADTRLKSFDQIKDTIKRVIDTCAPGGGFIFNTDKAFLTPGDINPTLIECYNFAHEYSRK